LLKLDKLCIKDQLPKALSNQRNHGEGGI